MVRVFYEPPPFGPKTCLNRSGYGMTGGGLFGPWLEKIYKSPRPGLMMAIPVVAVCVICYIPVANLPLPFSMEPEYQAASRAYMRYHNMNPISGISSKRARAMDPEA